MMNTVICTHFTVFDFQILLIYTTKITTQTKNNDIYDTWRYIIYNHRSLPDNDNTDLSFCFIKTNMAVGIYD